METSEHQEWRSRQQLDLSAVMKTTLTTGMIFFAMSGGSPWSTAGTMNAIMGREVHAHFLILLLGHFLATFVYTLIIGWSIYRLKTPLAVSMAIVVGMGLYLLNVVVFLSTGAEAINREFVTFFVHLVYSLFAGLLYKAFSFPTKQAS